MAGLFTKDAREILDMDGTRLFNAMAEANRLRELRHGQSINLCWIVNAKSGGCDQNCNFCSQSSQSTADITKYDLIGSDEIVSAAEEASEGGAVRFSIVTSGGAVEEGRELATILEAVGRIADETALNVCVSLGCVDRYVLRALRQAGVKRYHHNMETAESYWPRVCTTRTYEESRRVIRNAQEEGLEVCSGGIFGMGESLDQRIELLDEVKSLGVESVAINFFVPIPGTPFAEIPPITPLECLKVVIAARMMMPRRDIRVCGGREKNVRSLQPMLVTSGVSGLMIGGYLTTPGRSAQEDLDMIRDLGLAPDTIPQGRTTITMNPDKQ